MIIDISIHTPLAGRDGQGGTMAGMKDKIFQSTRPLRGVTVAFKEQRYLLYISIHTPLAGRDQSA